MLSLRRALIAALPAVLLAGVGMSTATSALAQTVTITEPKDGATVPSKFRVRLEASGTRLTAAGEGGSHHHILVNSDPIPAGEEIPFTRRHIHLNKGQTEIEITLQPGTYKLTAQLGDSDHKSLGPRAARTITITVQ